MIFVNTLSPVPSDSVTGMAPWIRLVREPVTDTLYSRVERDNLRGPRDVFLLLNDRIANEEQEVIVVLTLDGQHRVIAATEVTRGIVNSSLVHPREVFRFAIALGASAIIVIHNHPSGDPTPSPDDRVVTAQLVASGELLGIPVQDHIIIGDGRYVSFAEAGLL
jgi:DNA repair protein RadC